MIERRRWDPCVSHRGGEVTDFINDYFAMSDRRILLLAGAGFDPRSTTVANSLASVAKHLSALFIKEGRPNPDSDLVSRAEKNKADLEVTIPDHHVIPVKIFGEGGAVIGGRNVIAQLCDYPLKAVTDVVIDTSALSVGTSFPIIRYFVELIGGETSPANLHVLVAHNPELDADIQSIPSDEPGYIHGFRGRSTLDDAARAAKLWLPQLASGRRDALTRLFTFVSPHDTCPIMPFPATDPRLADKLAEEYLTEFENTWDVDTHNIVYADEDDPLDLYRTILELDDLRKPVFAGAGGSLLVLSPLGSKVMALGALMAALERDLPVAYLESLGYNLRKSIQNTTSEPNLIHVWLEGEAYHAGRPPLLASGAGGYDL